MRRAWCRISIYKTSKKQNLSQTKKKLHHASPFVLRSQTKQMDNTCSNEERSVQFRSRPGGQEVNMHTDNK